MKRKLAVWAGAQGWDFWGAGPAWDKKNKQKKAEGAKDFLVQGQRYGGEEEKDFVEGERCCREE